jgi:hypothetical protein
VPTLAAPWRWATEKVGGGGYNGYTGRWSPLGLDTIRQASANTTSIGREIDRPLGACDRPAASRAETNHITQVYLGVSAVSRSKQSVTYGDSVGREWSRHLFITMLSDDPLCATVLAIVCHVHAPIGAALKTRWEGCGAGSRQTSWPRSCRARR